MKYLLAGFMMSIGWHLAKASLEEVYICIYKRKNEKFRTLPDTVNYREYN